MLLLQKAGVENSFICMENGCGLGSTILEGKAGELHGYTPCHFPATIFALLLKEKKTQEGLC